MNNFVKETLLFAPVFLICCFFIIFFTVVGIKSLLPTVKKKKTVVKSDKPKTVTHKKPVRTIEINPSNIDKIYFKND